MVDGGGVFRVSGGGVVLWQSGGPDRSPARVLAEPGRVRGAGAPVRGGHRGVDVVRDSDPDRGRDRCGYRGEHLVPGGALAEGIAGWVARGDAPDRLAFGGD